MLWPRISLLLLFALVLIGCTKTVEPPDHPRLTANVVMRDVVFHSVALGREMRYRVVAPASLGSNHNLPVVYLLHGAGGGFRDWSDFSDVAKYAEAGLVLVMPQGDYSYYVNAAERPRDRYEDYIVQDLPADVESRFPVAKAPAKRAIAGVSMGGFGAIKIALSHPSLFAFAGALSAAIDVPRRPFAMKRFQQYRAQEALFGPWGSNERHRRDPFLLVRLADTVNTPYLFLSCGDRESLLPPNREFAAVLVQHHLRHEFHIVPGDHNWQQWNRQLPALFEQVDRRLRSDI